MQTETVRSNFLQNTSRIREALGGREGGYRRMEMRNQNAGGAETEEQRVGGEEEASAANVLASRLQSSSRALNPESCSPSADKQGRQIWGGGQTRLTSPGTLISEQNRWKMHNNALAAASCRRQLQILNREDEESEEGLFLSVTCLKQTEPPHRSLPRENCSAFRIAEATTRSQKKKKPTT